MAKCPGSKLCKRHVYVRPPWWRARHAPNYCRGQAAAALQHSRSVVFRCSVAVTQSAVARVVAAALVVGGGTGSLEDIGRLRVDVTMSSNRRKQSP